MARCYPDWFWVGIDACRDLMAESASRAAAKPKHGGLSNALFVAAAVEALPPELAGAADLITIQFPWGSLLRAVLLPDAPVLAGIGRLARLGAALEVVLNTTVFRPPVPREVADLPVPTDDFVRDVLAPAYVRAGIALTDQQTFGRAQIAAWPSTWAKRLASGHAPEALVLTGTVGGGGPYTRLPTGRARS